MSVDDMSGWLTIYFSEIERIVFEENGEKMRFSRKNSIDHVLNRGEPFDRSTIKVFDGISGTIAYSTTEAIELETGLCTRLDKTFKDDWGLNLSLERLGFRIGDKKDNPSTRPDEPSPLPDGSQLFTFSADVNGDGIPDNLDLIVSEENGASLRFRNGLSGAEMPHKIPQLGGEYHGTNFLSTDKKTGAAKLILWLWWLPDSKTLGITFREFCFSHLKEDEQTETQLIWKLSSLRSSDRYDTYATHELFPYIRDFPSDDEHSLYLLYDNSGGAVRQSTPDQLIEADTALITEILTPKMADYLALLS